MTSVPEVSVIIPTRDRWHMLSRSGLPAALMQEDVSLEVIVVDDASTDETAQRLAKISDPRLILLRNSRRTGVAAARNRGIEAARGTWLAFLDDDDVWAPRKLREQIDLAVQHAASFAYSSSVSIDVRRQPRSYSVVSESAEIRASLFRGNVVPGGCSNVVARATLVRGVGGFDTRLSMLADWDLWLRLGLEGKGVCTRALHVGYQDHSGNMVRTRPSDILAESAYIGAKYRNWRRAGYVIDHLAPVRWAASIDLGTGHPIRAAGLLLRAGLGDRSVREIGLALRFLWAAGPRRLLVRLRRAQRRPRAESERPEPPPWLDAYEPIGP